jgi:hypothetical protein
MSERKQTAVPGVCAGHPEHPELLWIFDISRSGQLRFSHIEIDFPEHVATGEVQFRKYDVDMSGFTGCPYCEATLYFFCKRCKTLSCFSWEQVNEQRQWTCHNCESTYRMKPKKTPFRVEAQVGGEAGQNLNETTSSSLSGNSAIRPKASIQDTQMWHPKIK